MAVQTSALVALSDVKTRLSISGSTEDARLNALIDEISGKIQDRCGRRLVQEAYTNEFYSGTDDDLLILRQGPLVSIESVEDVDYDSGGASYTTVNASDYIMEGRRDENWRYQGRIRRINGAWLIGRRNYRISYTAGYDSADLPHSLRHACLNWIQFWYLKRDSFGKTKSRIGDGDEQWLSMAQVDDAIEREIAKYRLPGLARA